MNLRGASLAMWTSSAATVGSERDMSPHVELDPTRRQRCESSDAIAFFEHALPAEDRVLYEILISG